MKKIVVLLVLLTILCFLITATLIVLKKDEQRIAHEEELLSKSRESVQLYKECHLPNLDDVEGATLSQTFDINAIGFKKAKYEDEKIIGEFLIIDGLADEVVEDKINKKLKNAIITYGNFIYNEIKEYVKNNTYESRDKNYIELSKVIGDKSYSYYDKEFYSNDDGWKVKVNEAILSNFSNVLSIMVSEDDNFYPYSDHQYVNLNLIDGENIKLEDLFTKDYSTINHFKDAIYKSFGDGEVKYSNYETYTDDEGKEYTWGYGTGVYESVDVEKQERVVRKFKYTDDINFGFSDEAVIIEFDDYKANLDFEENPEKVAIFNRYLKDGLYDGTYNTIKNVPAFCNASRGAKLKDAKCFEQIGNVVANYYITFNGSMENESKYKNHINWAIDEINQKVNDHIRKLNDSYAGNNLLLYSGSFNINFINVQLKTQDIQYVPYVKNGTLIMKFDFEPSVYEMTKEDVNILQSDFVNNFYDDLTSYRNENSIYDEATEKWIYDKKFILKEYRPFYTEIEPTMYEEHKSEYNDSGYYYNCKYDDYYLVNDNYRIINKSDLLDIVILDKVSFAHKVFDSIPNNQLYSYINRDNYNFNIGLNDISISFPYYHFDSEYGGYWTSYFKNFSFEGDNYYSTERSPMINCSYFY